MGNDSPERPADSGSSPPPLPRRPLPAIPISEPGVVTPPPFASVYTPPPAAGVPESLTMSPAPPAGGFYPPPYPAARGDHYTADGPARTRPGLITFLGVSAIVFAALSILASLFSGCSGLATLSAARQAGTFVQAGAPGAPALAAPSVSENGLDDDDRAAVINAIRQKMSWTLDARRLNQLNEFLSIHGKLIFPEGLAGREAALARAVTSAGREYAGPGKTGADYFVFSESEAVLMPGRLRVQDDRASFSPRAGGATLYSLDSQGNASPSPQAVQVMSPAQLRAIMGQIQTKSNNRLNARQTATINRLLNSYASPNWVSSTSTVAGASAQVQYVIVNPDGSATIGFNAGSMQLDPAGNLLGGAGLPIPVTSSSNLGAAGVATTFGVSESSCRTVVVEAVFSGLIAVLLLFAGIQCLRQVGMSRWMLLLFSVLKLASGILAIIALTSMIGSIESADDFVRRFQRSVLTGAARTSLFAAMIGLIYPLAVIGILLGSRQVKEYYRTAG